MLEKPLEPWQEAFIEMLANPCDNRTNRDFAAEHGITEIMLYRWKADNRERIYELADKRRKKYFNELREKNFKAIVKNLDKSFNDRKLMSQLLGDLIERTESRTEYMTPEDKRKKINEILSQFVNKDQGTGGVPGSASGDNHNNTSKDNI